MMTDLPSFRPKQGDPDKCAVLVPVANDQALRIFVHRQRRHQLRLAPSFEPEMKLLARIDNFFDHFAQLIDLDRKNTAIVVAIAELGDRRLKCAIDRFHAVPEQVREPHDQRETKAARPRFIHHFEKVNRAAIFLKWFGDDIAIRVDREITASPCIHVVGGDGGLEVPVVFHSRSWWPPKGFGAKRIMGSARKTCKHARTDFGENFRIFSGGRILTLSLWPR